MGFGVPLNPSYASYFSNITGFIQGPVKTYNLTTNGSDPIAETTSTASISYPNPKEPIIPPWTNLGYEFVKDINMTAALEHIGTWDWAADTTLTFRVVEKLPILSSRMKPGKDVQRMNETTWSGISLMHGRVELEDKQSEEELDFDLEAVHFQENGTIYGLAEPAG